jgi:hypothetical protein
MLPLPFFKTKNYEASKAFEGFIVTLIQKSYGYEGGDVKIILSLSVFYHYHLNSYFFLDSFEIFGRLIMY